MVVDNHVKRRLRLTVAHVPSRFFRPAWNLLWNKKTSAAEVPFSKGSHAGTPIFARREWDWGASAITSKKMYKPPYKPQPRLKRNWTIDDMHEMKARVRFTTTGRFPGMGYGFERQCFKAADDMYLKGWIRCRSNFAVGVVEGDLWAVMYFRKWLKERHATGVDMNKVVFSEENYGITKFSYDRLISVKDWRGFTKKRDHQANRSQAREATAMLSESAEVNSASTAEVLF